MSITKSGIVLALCVLSQTVQGAEVRRAAPSGQVRATTPRVTVKRTPRVTVKGTPPVVVYHRSMTFGDALKVMAPFRQWMIGANKTGLVHTRTTDFYNLKGTVKRKFLQYEKQGAGQGINLGWTDNASANTATKRSRWFFRKLTNEPVRYGERVAIGWHTAHYTNTSNFNFIKYASRNVGINLDWSKKPSYEWAILGGKPGERVKRGEDLVVIYNLKHKQPLIYFDRTVGGHIGWPDSRTWGTGNIGNLEEEDAAMEAVVKALLMPGARSFPKHGK